MPLAQRMQACRTSNPLCRYRLFDSRRANKFLRRWYGREISEGFLSIRMEAMKSDVFRVAWTLRKGGIYVDAASVVAAPFSGWIHPEKLTLLRKPKMKDWGVWNGFISAPFKNHPILDGVWMRLEQVLISRQCSGIWEGTGPGLFNSVIRQMGDDELRSLAILKSDAFGSDFDFGSSGQFLGKNQHWSIRQASGESLFLDA